VEERILPYAISVGEDEKPIDYNFRVITSLGKYPKIVAAEVRASEMSYGPVNVARGADAYPAYKLLEYLPDEVLSSVYEAALIGSEVLREAVGGDGGSELLQLVGFDIIPSQDGKAYILEINPSGGGIGTLSKLAHGTPPDGIVTRFFPDTMPLLEENRDEKTAKGRSLQRLPLDSSGYEVAGYTLHDAREYERALLLLSDALDIFPGQTEYRKMVAQTYFSAGHYDRASEWFAVSEMYSPGDTRVNLLAATAAFLTGDLEDVQGILDEISTPKTFQDLIGIADIRALVEFHETNDLTRAVRVLQEQFPELLSEKEAEEEILHLSARFERLQSHKIELPRDPFNQSDRPIVVF
jgi:tetratricopeptide (TPR) repeat protein